MGAKKYVCRIDGKLVCTIAGVGKKAGGKELEAAGGISAFAPGFTFVDAGGVEAVYNDDPHVPALEIDGHRLEFTRNVSLRPSTYTLGLSAEYEQLLRHMRFTIDNYEFVDYNGDTGEFQIF